MSERDLTTATDAPSFADEEVLILAVDDTRANLIALERTLAPVDARLITASSGEEALAACVRHRFALAILDVQMPHMDGYELAEILLADPATAQTPIIFLTAAHADEQHLFRGYSAGAVDYIVKPYDPVILLAKVRVFLELARRRMDLEGAVVERTRALRASEQRYRTLFETMAQGVVYQDGAGLISEVNPAAARILGVSRDGLLGRESTDGRWQAVREDGSAFPGEEHPAMVAMRTGRPVRDVLMGIRRERDGSQAWINIDATPQFGPGATRPELVYTTFSDVTDRVAAQHALVDSEQALRAVFDGTQDGVVAIDGDGFGVVMANDAMFRMFGWSREEFPSDAGADALLTPQGLDRLVEANGARADGASAPVDLELSRRDGSGLIVEVAVSRVELRRRRCLLCVFRDVTERRRAEAERQRLQAELFRTQKMESVGMLAGGIAHDFNNLLSVIVGYVGFALERLDPGDPTYEDLLEVKRAGERSAVLTRQLLAFGRKQVMQRRPVDLNQIAHGVQKLLGRIIGEDVVLSLALEDALGVVSADPGQIEQVIMNLAVNARDAMPHGGRLTLSTANVVVDAAEAARHAELAPGSYVRLTVDDTGCGIDADALPQIFEPFFTTKPKGKGTGLGLSTVYGIVKQTDGHMTVASVPGVGTTFDIYLPRLEAEVAAPVVEAPLAATCRGGTETVLVVEDAEPVRNLAARALRSAGYEVIVACDGIEALRVAETWAGHIDLVLTDVVMPGLGGEELAVRLGQWRPATGVLFMSGYTDTAFRREGVVDVPRNFIQKPFVISDLLLRVRRALDARAGAPDVGGACEPIAQPAGAVLPVVVDVPLELAARLRRAAVAARHDELLGLLQSNRGVLADGAESLIASVQRFDYDELLSVLDVSVAQGALHG